MPALPSALTSSALTSSWGCCAGSWPRHHTPRLTVVKDPGSCLTSPSTLGWGLSLIQALHFMDIDPRKSCPHLPLSHI